MACISPLLPTEIVESVVAYLPLHDLTSASLVCRVWRLGAFPHLYHTVYLTLRRHLQLFSERVANENTGTLPLSIYTRGLVFDENNQTITREPTGVIREQDLADLAILVPKLVRLECFHWHLPYIPRNTKLLTALQNECTSLKSLHWRIGENRNTLDFEADEFLRLFRFKDLSEFSLVSRCLPMGSRRNQLNPIVSLIHLSPGIESLTLDLHDFHSAMSAWSPRALTAALDPHTLPCLHTFRALGAVDPKWYAFFRQPDSHPLRAFFIRHPGLRTIALGSVDEFRLPEFIDPSDLASIFPSLRNIEAPFFLCEPILASTLAEQLESIGFIDNWDVTRYNLQSVANSVAPLPKLRKLGFFGGGGYVIEVGPLKTLLNAAPNLEELEMLYPIDPPGKLLEVLQAAKNLRVLSILTGSGWRNCISLIAQVCPLLTHVKDWSPGNKTTYWVINRSLSGVVEIARCISC